MAIIKHLPPSEWQRKIWVKQWFNFEAGRSMELLLSYVAGVEAQVKASLGEYEEGKEEWEKSCFDLIKADASEMEYPDFEHKDLSGRMEEMQHVFEDFFPSLQRSAALISIWSIFESQASNLCKLVQHAIESKLKLKDLGGQGVERAKTYLTKVGGFDLTVGGGEKHWNNIAYIREARNCFAHADGLINDQNKKTLEKYAKESKFLKIEDYGLVLLEGYLEEAVAGCLRYLEVMKKAADVRFPNGR